jgi:putrescine transport system permease protein
MRNPAQTSAAQLGAATNASPALASFKQSLAKLLPSGRSTVIGIPFIWLAVFFALPFVLVLKISLPICASAFRLIRNSSASKMAWCISRCN